MRLAMMFFATRGAICFGAVVVHLRPRSDGALRHVLQLRIRLQRLQRNAVEQHVPERRGRNDPDAGRPSTS